MNETAEKFKNEDLVEDIVAKYPPKVARKRRQHMVPVEPGTEQRIAANARSIPGIITQRGCCYAGCKGVVLGPIVDMVHIVHGPIGCSFYAWGTRRNQGKARKGGQNYLEYCFSTDMQPDNIIFGGEKKLRQAIEEAHEIFNPRAISVHATCPAGLIGDDVIGVGREMTEKLGIPVIGFACEGYKGVSQSAGHHLANNGLFENVVGLEDKESGKFSINMLGEYNIGGDAWEIERIFEKCGINIVATFSGNGSFEDIAQSHNAKLNVIQCHRSINYMAEMMEDKFGIPWLKVNVIGLKSTSKSLRKIGDFFEDKKLSARIEEVIAEEEAAAEEKMAPLRERLQGKTAMLFTGGSRAHHYQSLFKDLGMKTVVAGEEFAHRDDYEGRKVIPTIKIDADSRNITELKVEKDPARYHPPKSAKEITRLKEAGALSQYEGMLPDMTANSILVDDITHLEQEMMIASYKPDIVCSGIKDKYIFEKMGIPSKQLHNYDYSGPFAGYQGAVNFARDIDMRVNNPAWKMIPPPWQQRPMIKAEMVVETEKEIRA
jgi:nitrogenase molybdenum-iron protein alpha chain